MAYRGLRSIKASLNKRQPEFGNGFASYRLDFENNSLIPLSIMFNNSVVIVVPGTGEKHSTGELVITNRIDMTSRSLEPVKIYHYVQTIANMCLPELHNANFAALNNKHAERMFFPNQINTGRKESAATCSLAIEDIKADEAVYVPLFDVVVSTLTPDALREAGIYHPAQRNSERAGVYDELYDAGNTSIIAYKLVDSNDRVGNRWFLLGGLPHELKAVRNVRLLDGLYLITNTRGGPNGGAGNKVEAYWSLEQLLGEEPNSEENERQGFFIPKTYASRRDALNLGDDKKAQELEIARNKLRLEELKAEQVEAEHRRKLLDEERVRTRAEEEHKRKMEIFAAKEADDRRKAELEREKALREELNAQWRATLEKEKAARDLAKDEESSKRETKTNLLKLVITIVGAIASTIGGIAAIYKGYVELRKLFGKPNNDKPVGG